MATQAEIDAIRARIVEIDKVLDTGATTITAKDRSTSFDLRTLRERRRELLDELAAATGTPRIRQVYIYSTKGL